MAQPSGPQNRPPGPPRPEPGGPPPNPWATLLPWLVAVALLVGLSLLQAPGGPETVPYSRVKALVQDGAAESAVLEEHAITISVPAEGGGTRELRAELPDLDDPELLGLLEAREVEISGRAPRGVSVFAYLLPWVAILALFLFLQRRMTGAMGGLDRRGLGGLFSGRFSTPAQTRTRVGFDDVAGQDQAKKEVAELVEFLREPDRFGRVGAEVPHGVLLMGPPGTGKTLLAKALAGEAEVPFFSTSGSEFVEVFVGVGAGRVRKMFEAARAAAPAVVFIDELDSIGRRRGAGLGGGHDERGFERLAMAIQQKPSNYDTDVFTPLIDKVSSWAKVQYGDQKETDIALRVMVDHIRAIAFAVADGQLPSNNKAGYVIRRILRRAVRYGYTFLNFKKPFLYQLLPILSEQFDEIFPELKAQQDFVMKVVQEEEASFLRTLEVGLKKMEQIKQSHKDDKRIPGSVAFELYDTFGFPLDLTALIARESGFTVDEVGFQKEMALQKERSKGAATVDTGDWVVVRETDRVDFVGYDMLATEAQLVRYRQMKEKKKTYYQLVLDRTPFYPEGGGQIGDTGYLEADGKKISIFDTKKENELIIHYAKELPEDTEATFRCVVNENKRLLTMNNHSATHLLHAALKEVLGEHVQQKGSLVNNQLLRFDFSHFAKMTNEEIRRVEHIVNQRIRANIQLEEMRNVPMEEAKAMGATALFGEKYGDYVRVIAFDRDFSLELCGGTHVPSTGNIGLFKITTESSISAGVRRIEAITADTAEKYVEEQDILLKEINEVLKNPTDLKKAVKNLLQERSQLQKELESLQEKEALNVKDQILDKATSVRDAVLIVDKIAIPSVDMLKKLAFDIKNQKSKLVLVLAADVGGKPQIAMAIDESLIKQYDLHAGNMVRELAKNIKGGGGGQPFFATAGGKDVSGLDKVVSEARKMLEKKLQ